MHFSKVFGLRQRGDVEHVVIDAEKRPKFSRHYSVYLEDRPGTADTGRTFKSKASSKMRKSLAKVRNIILHGYRPDSAMEDSQRVNLGIQSTPTANSSQAALIVDLKSGAIRRDEAVRKPAALVKAPPKESNHGRSNDEEQNPPSHSDPARSYLVLPRPQANAYTLQSLGVRLIPQSAEYRRDALTSQAYGAIKDDAHCQLVIHIISGWRLLPPTANPFVIIDNMHCPLYHSQMTDSDWRWIERVEAWSSIIALFNRRALSEDDTNMILHNLFPEKATQLWVPEIFSVNLSALASEHILSAQQAIHLYSLCTSPTELTWTAPIKSRPPIRGTFHRLPLTDQPAAPPPGHMFSASRTAQLTALIEAALFNQSTWLEAHFPAPRSTLEKYLAAHHLSESACNTPPDLTPYKRNWSCVEKRMLRAAHLVLDLQARFDAGLVSDFGIVKMLRGCYFWTRGQICASVEGLRAFLFDRVPGSGVGIAEIVGMLVLHPDYDGLAREEGEEMLLRRLWEEVGEFAEGERAREEEVRAARKEFRRRVKGGLRKRERVWEIVRRVLWCGGDCGGRLAPFDPFAEAHDEEWTRRVRVGGSRGDWSFRE